MQQKFQQALAFHQCGKLAHAKALYEEILEVQPRHIHALHLLGVIAFQSNDAPKAVALIGKAIAMDPNNAAFYSNRGLALQELKQLDAAVESFDRAIAIKPDYADAYSNRGNALQLLKQLAAAVASYDRAIAIKPDFAEAYYNRGNALQELRRFDAAVASYDQAIALKPDYAEARYNRGNALQELAQFDAAVASYDQAIAIKPDYAEAYSNRGNALQELTRFDAAVASYDQAMAIGPDNAEAYYNRGNVFGELMQFDAALASYDQAIAIKPDYAEAFSNRGNALRQVKRFDAALNNYDRAIAIKPDYAEACLNKSLALLASGDFVKGWELFEWRWKSKALRKEYRAIPQPLWLGKESLAGKIILLHSEQGLGDTMQFVRYAPLVAQLGARVLLLVQPPLKRLLADLDGVAAVYTESRGLPAFECHCPLMSLPYAFGTELATVPAAIPYLHADAGAAAGWRKWLGEGLPSVGLVWAGAAREGDPRANRVDQRRSLALSQLAPLAGVSGVRFVSLQKGPPAQQARRPPPGMDLADPTANLEDFADTAALVANLDLVITVDTSVAHLAGAMGKPVWILSRFDGCWRWLIDRDDSPWYPTARLFRQPAVGDWDSVIARVAQALRMGVSIARA